MKSIISKNNSIRQPKIKSNLPLKPLTEYRNDKTTIKMIGKHKMPVIIAKIFFLKDKSLKESKFSSSDFRLLI